MRRTKQDVALGPGQYHLAVAVGAQPFVSECVYDVPTRYREVVLTRSKSSSN